MLTSTETPRAKDPFALDGEYPFIDALIIQCVGSPTTLQWKPGEAGFFVETETAPEETFVPATFITRTGKRISGYAAKTWLMFPVAYRIFWEFGGPGDRVRLPRYQEGSRSHTQVLAMLPSGVWAVTSARGPDSHKLANAFRCHRYQTAKKLLAMPFAVALSGDICRGEKTGADPAAKFAFVTLQDERCPEELGFAVRNRWREVERWQREKEHCFPNRCDEQIGFGVEAPAPDSHMPSPVGDVKRCATCGQQLPRHAPTCSKLKNAAKYRDGTPVNHGSPMERQAFWEFKITRREIPFNRDALRNWWIAHNVGGDK